MRIVPLLALSSCSLFEPTVVTGGVPAGFDAALLGETSYGFTGTALAAAELDGGPGDDLVVVADSEPGGAFTSSCAAVWTGSWTGGYPLEQDAFARYSAPIGANLVSAATGDFDGDGDADLAFGAPNAGVVTTRGAVYLVKGPLNRGTHSLALAAGNWDGDAGDEAGSRIHSLGDWNGDGVDDLLVTIEDPQEVVFAYGPLDQHGSLSTFTDRLAAPGDWFRGPEAGVGDLNADGSPDLALGVAYAGRVYVFLHHPSGAASLDDADWILDGNPPADDATTATTPGAMTGTSSGTSTVDTGGSSGTGAPLISSYFGSGLAVGDVNGDGVDDLVVGEPFPQGGRGMVHVFHGPVDPTDTLADADLVLQGDLHEGVGSVLRIGGDLDSDGVNELVLADWNVIGAASSRLWLTDADGTGQVDLAARDTLLLETDSGDGLAMYGGLVAGHDFDGDGLPDLAVGAPGGEGLSAAAGSAYVRLGTP